MFTKRIIPCLDVNDGRVVKGVNFVNLKDAGDPVEIARAYDRAGADAVSYTHLDVYKRQAHSYGVKVMYHSCGSIVDAIPLLIEAGVDIIHPIQALAAGMEMCIRDSRPVSDHFIWKRNDQGAV